MGASITLAGESLIAQKHASQEGLDVVRFIFANVPGLDHSGPVDRAAAKPAAGQIVYSAEIPDENAGFVNPNQVVYSVQAGSDVGDWDFNWIGLETTEGVLFAVAYVPLQQKRRNIPPLQIGNNLTRNFLLAFDGAQALTGITIDASTWQHDFTIRLAGIDERERQSNRDIFGRACFFGSALQLEKVGAVYQLKTGTAYVEGIRLQRAAVLPVVPPAFPTTAWLDVALQRELNDVVASWSVVWGAGKVDYVDSAGVQHYCVAIADLPNSNTITDNRPVENIAGALVTHFAARVGDYAGLRARATTKDDVGLGNLPNAKSDDENTDSSLILATTKAVKAATATIWTAIANIVSGATTVGKAAKLATARTINEVPFDGSASITVADATKEPAIAAGTAAQYWRGNKTWADFATAVRGAVLTGLSTATSAAVLATDSVLAAIGKLQAQVSLKLDATANAVSASKLATPRTIALTGDVTGSVAFDGSGNASIAATGVQAAKLKTARTIALTGAVTGSVAFDGSGNASIATTATQATETVAGGSKVASQLQTDAGANDTAYITPKKLRWGAYMLLQESGYVRLPSWLGGLMFQWGMTGAGVSVSTTFPLEFDAIFQITVAESGSNTGGTADNVITAISTTGFTCYGSATGNFSRYLAIGV